MKRDWFLISRKSVATIWMAITILCCINAFRVNKINETSDFMEYLLINATHEKIIIDASKGIPVKNTLFLSSRIPVEGETSGFIVCPSLHGDRSNIMMIMWPDVCDPRTNVLDLHAKVVAYLYQLLPMFRTLFVQDNVDQSLSNFITYHCRKDFLPVKLAELTKRVKDDRESLINEIVWRTPNIILSSYTTLLKHYLRKLVIDHWKISFDRAMEFSVEQFDTHRFIWYPLSSISIVVDTKCISPSCRSNDTINGRNHHEEDLLTLTLLRLKVELNELKTLAVINVIYGYFVKNSEFRMFEEDCNYLTYFLKDEVNVVCAAMEVIEEATDFATGSSSIEENSKVIFGRSYYGDIREVLSQYAYDRFASDYYYLLDLENIFFHQIPSILTAINQIQYGTLIPRFGILLHTSSKNKKETDDFEATGNFRDINHYPFNPILTKSYFEVFPVEFHLFQPSFPRSINNYLLFDIFDIFDGVVVNENTLSRNYVLEENTSASNAKALGGSDSISVVNTYLLSFQMYNTIMVNGRQRVLHYLNDRFFGKDAEVILTEKDLDIQRGDIFYDLFCSSVTDVNENLPYQCESFIEEIGNRDNDNMELFDPIQNSTHGVYYPPALYVAPPRDIERQSSNKSVGRPTGRVAVITAIFGSYEKSCKPFVRQTVSTDFYCFTDNDDIVRNGQRRNGDRRKVRNGWIIDTTPYHLRDLEYDIEQNLTSQTNSYHNNMHPFNIAKYYKTNFHHIEVLRGYDVVIWIDGTVRIVNPEMSKKVLDVLLYQNETMMVFELARNQSIEIEAKASMNVNKYVATEWLGHPQPIQNVSRQYEIYVNNYGYRNTYWKEYLERKSVETGSLDLLDRNQYGVWCTCFVAFNMKKKDTFSFLDLWHNQIRSFTTQDQVSFPFVVQQLGIHPYSLPQGEIYGNYDMNSFFIKLNHGL